ncbi:MAG: hypothetical protein LBP41_00925 [Holosporaceae bacterium]|jgi:hypothetical protein|nr:hypothetical protein [Holosporaceae bacterium]
MELLRKIVIVMMVAVTAWNADGVPVLDFDTIVALGTNIPTSFQPKWNNTAVNANPANVAAPNGRYVYFTVVPNGGGAVGNVNFAQLNVNAAPPAVAAAAIPPVAGDINIYFPEDGHQPTTAEAVAWSCANIDNREDSPITEWYMKMFGVIPIIPAALGGGGAPAVYMQAGWNNAVPPAAQRIISFHANVPEAVPGAPQITRQQLFIRNFRKIASTSVGRVLLYRILIEIMRKTAVGNAIGILDNNVPIIANMNTRNNNRSIEIRYGAEIIFFETSARISVNFSKQVRKIRPTIIGRRNKLYSYIATDPSTSDIDIFHEMTHWYHQLRNPNRQTNERNFDLNQFAHFAIYQDYWGAINGTDEERRLSMTPWIGTSTDYVAGEEIRTILGKQNVATFQDIEGSQYFEGDDISENLYRACLRKPLRFGHDKNAFYEDNRVIDKAINVTANIIGYYLNNAENPLYRNTKIFDKGYRPPYNKKGLGFGYYK